MRVYLDNCVLNRPLDDQQQDRIRLESEAVKELRKQIEQGKVDLVWSYVLDFENFKSPFAVRRLSVASWKDLSALEVGPSAEIDSTALELRDLGLADIDSLHVACAVAGKSNYFVTTDDAIIKRSAVLSSRLVISNPIDLLEVVKKL